MSENETPANWPNPENSLIKRLLTTQRRVTREFVAEVLQMRGLMPLLMKPRNGGKWTAEEKAELLHQLRLLSRLSPVLLLLLLPGSIVLLPIYAWWLERRRKRRATSVVISATTPLAQPIAASLPATTPGLPPGSPGSDAAPDRS